MQYFTIKQLANLAGVTIKTLYHYHKIKLLIPCKITDVGYRLYSMNELEQLQQILFYKELDFSLSEIKKAMEDEPSRLKCLTKQQELLFARRQRMDCLLDIIEESIDSAKKGKNMDQSKMFHGFNTEGWNQALSGQNEYLKEKYDFDLPAVQEAQVDQMNRSAAEAQQFIRDMAAALKGGWRADDERVRKILKEHISFLNESPSGMNEKSFLNVAKFMVEDDFHRKMLEDQQTGLSYYLYTSAQILASE